jgi:hypothetical protein
MSNNFLSVVADGRTVIMYEDGSYEFCNEIEKKIEILTKKVFLCPTGLLDDANKFINDSSMKKSIMESGKLRKEIDIENWYQSVKEKIKTRSFFEIKFGGLSIDGKLQVYTISSKEDHLIKTRTDEPKIIYSFSNSQAITKEYVKKVLINLFESGRYSHTLRGMIELQYDLNDIIADNDVLINKNKTRFTLSI